jgi:hypothetical protein
MKKPKETSYITLEDYCRALENYIEYLEKGKKTNIDDRKEFFMQKVANFIDDYPREMLREFYDYWTEHGERDRKFRMEKEKSFDISKRLARWFKNYKPSTNVQKNQKIIETFKKDAQGWG